MTHLRELFKYLGWVHIVPLTVCACGAVSALSYVYLSYGYIQKVIYVTKFTLSIRTLWNNYGAYQADTSEVLWRQ